MKLQIVIPAYNEEESIEKTILKTLSARQHIINTTGLSEVGITVVSDGSVDKTVEILKKYSNAIHLIVFEKNKGYGAAIKEGWEQSDAELLGFMDADGTCDPNFFSNLCNSLIYENSDVVVGNRMHSDSKMPIIRRVGNKIFALMLSIFSSKKINDCTSGMRVIQKTSLPKLLPLPDGLHFTPSMSARAILSNYLTIKEMDMPYAEREGQSKLKVIQDGIRFLKIILKTVFLYRPSRPLAMLALFFLLTAVFLMILPTLYYIRTQMVLEWMIYRFISSNLLGTTACLLFCSSYLSRKIVDMTISNQDEKQRTEPIFNKFFKSRFYWYCIITMIIFGVALVLPSYLDHVRTGATYEHWSRFIAMSYLISTAFILIITRMLDYILDLIWDRLNYLKSLNK
ncbi:MAG: glycosyltransferase family 2 protein [Elusimicrobia bacterium]|nr:glycosyltransferase family 2 protein [Elusimicrobiota bacterium]